VKILRQVLGLLSLAAGLILLGECAAHTARGLIQFHPQGGSSALLLREAFFAWGHHGTPYLILLAMGAALFLAGVALTRTWALPIFAFALACLTLFGGMVVERAVSPKGAGASVLQDGISGIWSVAAEREDALVTLWMGLAALLCGIFVNYFLSHGFKKTPAGAPTSGKDKRAKPRTLSMPDAEPMAQTPLNPSEARVETSVDLDLSPDLETSEVQAPDPLSPELEEPMLPPQDLPEPEAPAAYEGAPEPTPVPLSSGSMEEEAPLPPPVADAPYVVEMEASAPVPTPVPAPEPPAPVSMPEPEEPEPSLVLPAAGTVLGLGSLGAAAASGLCVLEASTAGLVWAGAASAGFAGMGLALMARPLKGLGWTAVTISAGGLSGAVALLALGGG